MTERDRAIQSIRSRLQVQASPRVHMLVLVTITAACGFLSSVVMLKSGMHSMALRYPLAVGVSYLAFLGLVALWLRRYRLRARIRQEGRGTTVDLQILDVPFDALWSAPPIPEPDFAGFGAGGGFSGGGGGASWGDGPTAFHDIARVTSSHGGGGGGVVGGGGGGGGFDLDLDEGFLWLIPVIIIGAIVFGIVLYVVFTAPVLFAEVLLDAGLAAGLYKRLMREERRSWLVTAVRNTVVPAFLVAGLLAIAGSVMQGVYPDAASIGVVVRHLQEPARKPIADHRSLTRPS